MEATYERSDIDNVSESEMIPSQETSNNYITNDTYTINNTHKNSLDSNQRFEDDFGPETDVDGVEDARPIVDSNLSENPSENKMEHNSEQNKDIIYEDSSKSKTDLVQLYDEQTPTNLFFEQTVIENIETSQIVDNKIIDAIECLAITESKEQQHNIEDEKSEVENEKQGEYRTDLYEKSPDIVDVPEKVTLSDVEILNHENSMNIYKECADQGKALENEQVNTGCIVESAGEESGEEEGEWNYFKNDGKAELEPQYTIQQNLYGGIDPIEASFQLKVDTSESTIQTESINIESTLDQPIFCELSDIRSEESKHQDTTERVESPNASVEQQQNDKVSIEEKPEENTPKSSLSLLVGTDEATINEKLNLKSDVNSLDLLDPCISFSDESQLSQHLLNNTSSVEEHTEKSTEAYENKENEQDHEKYEQIEASIIQKKSMPEQPALESEDLLIDENEIVQEQQNRSSETVDELAESRMEELKTELDCSVSDQKETTPEIIKKVEEPTEIEKAAGDIDENLERPQSLNFEMASKLNPEAKEFVPISSPARSGPSSPVSNMPTTLQNPFLMIVDDKVVAQSPKKGNNVMDNIDLPAEDDFQHEMDIRPHELEKSSEYAINNVNTNAYSHSPASEPSYQELNLKESMQCDEKLENEYNDEKQTTDENSLEISSDNNIFSVPAKEHNSMNMSFYEGRDEGLLSNNSDELNKIHTLPDEEEQVDQELSPIENIQSTIIDDSSSYCPLVTTNITENEIEVAQTTNISEYENDKCVVDENSSSSILAAASQVVDHVTALIEQIPKNLDSFVSEDVMKQSEPQTSTPNVQAMQESLVVAKEDSNILHPHKDDDCVVENDLNIDIKEDVLVTVEIQNQENISQNAKNEIAIENPQNVFIATDNNYPCPEVQAVESDELTSTLIESLQQEVVAENEFITDESVLSVPSPTKHFYEHENLMSAADTPSVEHVSDEKVDVAAFAATTDTNTSVKMDTTNTPSTEHLSKEVSVSPSVISSLAAPKKSPAVTNKASVPKSTTLKAAKPPIGSEKKTTNTTKPLIKSNIKPATAAKTELTTVRKTTAISSTTTSNTNKTNVSKLMTSATTARSSVTNSATSKVEKKKPTTANGEPKTTLATKKPLIPTTKLSTTKSTSSTSNIKSPTTATAGAATKLTTSSKPMTAPIKTSLPSAKTARTSTALKARTIPPTTQKNVSLTAAPSTTSPTPIASMKTSTVKSTSATKTAPIGKTTPVTNQSSLKPNVPVAGLRKSSTTPNKKPSPSTTVAKVGTRTSSAKKSVPSKTEIASREKNASLGDNETNLSNLDKQLKNENNQLITKNGIDSQMIVIDSAAD